MRRYLVICYYQRPSDPPEHFLCEGDDAQHALEQAQDAYPNAKRRHDVFELVRVDPESGESGLTEPKERHVCNWLNLTSAEWEALPDSVRVKLWDALNSKLTT